MDGKIALCSRGIPGIITERDARSVMYDGGKSGIAYVGIALTTGRPWSSRKPIILGTFAEFVASGLSWKEWAEYVQLPDETPTEDNVQLSGGPIKPLKKKK